MRLRFGFAVAALVAGLAGVPALPAQTPAPHQTQTTVNLSPKLLPDSFGAEHRSGAPEGGSVSLTTINKDALEEFGPQRSDVAGFDGPKKLSVEAIEFADATGAFGAFTLVRTPEMRDTKDVKDLGSHAAFGSGAALWTSGTVLVLAYPATPADMPALKALDAVLPKAGGNKTVQPLLPTLVPEHGFVPGSLKYAIGQHSYQSEGGVLPSANLGWDKSGEAVTAKYSDRRGAETLTILMYPTPQIAGAFTRQIEALLPGLGPSFKVAKVRREGEIVILANGTFSPDAAQNMVENVHLRQILSTDKAMPTPEIVEYRKTYSTFAQVIIFAIVLAISGMLLGIFLGGGRALVRMLRGKPPATELEFLSLHLDPQNAKVELPRAE